MSNLPYPPMTDGADARQIIEVRRYLFRLVEELNNSLDSISSYGSYSGSSQQAGKSVSSKEKQEFDDTAAELKAMIVKNAKYVQDEMDEMTRSFKSTYVAKSEYGTFTEDIDNEVTQTAYGLDQKITATSEILGKFISSTNGYIRQGIVRYDGITPVIGIAIGQDITATGEKVTVNGVEYETIDTSHNMSIWTSDKLSFYVNGSEVAYFANNSLHVNRITIGDWTIDNSNGFAIKWVGGDS